jgi:preprotein translocase SecE subunit
LGTIAGRVAFVGRKSSDFMIATEGEMKKVSWSRKREVIGSTKVVIMFTLLLALLLFFVDLVFQYIFSEVGVLKI